MDTDILSLEDFLPYRLNRLADAVSREFSAIYRERFGLTRPEWRLLAALGQYGTMTATEVGRHSSMHKTKVSRAVSALENRRWLARRTDDADRRVEHLSLTKSGDQVYRDLVPLAKAFEERVLGSMKSRDRTAVVDGLNALETVALSGAADLRNRLTRNQPEPTLFQSKGPVKMTRYVAATELKARLSKLLGDVERGETIGITRHGKTIARLTPETAIDREDVRRAVEDMRSLRASLPKTGATLEEVLKWRHEGHRY